MIDLSSDHLATVRHILAVYVPECDVGAFGSRATGTAKPYSDLDLAVIGAHPLDWRVLGRLREAFAESDLPMRVEVLDWHTISESFREAIRQDLITVRRGRTDDPDEGQWHSGQSRPPSRPLYSL